jgi:arsenite oxidase small subunit
MKSCNRLVDLGRRQFLRGGATAAAATVAAGMIPRPADAAPALARITYPSARLANVTDLKVDVAVQIQYPDKDSPGVIIKLGRNAER